MKYVWAAYTITWLVVFAYTLFLGRKQAGLARDLEVVKQSLEGRARKHRGNKGK